MGNTTHCISAAYAINYYTRGAIMADSLKPITGNTKLGTDGWRMAGDAAAGLQPYTQQQQPEEVRVGSEEV